MNKTAFLFSGQGAQYPGMMKDIAGKSSSADKVFQMANELLNRDIKALCFSGTQEDLNLTQNTQPCVFAADMAAYMALSERGVFPDAVAGFSLGEYAALVVAGAIKSSDAMILVQKRANYMQEAVPVGVGSMAAIMKLSSEKIDELCESVNGYVVSANYNCPGQIVVAGEKEAVEQLVGLAKEQKGRAVVLPVSAPFHCEMMRPAAERLRMALEMIDIYEPALSIYMNVDAEVENNSVQIREKMVLQAMSPVLWEQTLRNMYRDGIRNFVELGPGKTLSSFVKKTFSEEDDVNVYNVTDLDTMENTATALSKIVTDER